MVDFVTSFRKGLNTAEEAINNHNEINAVFDALEEQLNQATNGQLKLTRKEFFERKATLDFSQQKEKYWAIAAENRLQDDSPVAELARWEPATAGYPAIVNYAGSEHICHSKEELESVLCSLLADPRIGDRLFRLLNSDEKTAEAEPQPSISADLSETLAASQAIEVNSPAEAQKEPKAKKPILPKRSLLKGYSS